MSKNQVLVLLVNWRRAIDTVLCIKSLLGSAHEDLSISICENSSPDDSFCQIKNGVNELLGVGDENTEKDTCIWKIGERRRIVLVRSSRNLGFAGGNNLAYARAIEVWGDIFSHAWFLNNDTEQDSSCLSAMLKKFSQDERIGICGSTMVYDFDRKTVQALGGSLYKPWTGLMSEIGNGLQWPQHVDEAVIEAEMSYVCGASMLVKTELIRQVGLMAEDYFIFFEEIDWCQRARGAGYKIAYASNAIVFHKEGAAIGTGNGLDRSLLAEYYGMRNKLLITRRFFPFALPTVWIVSWMQAFRRLLQGRQENALIMARTLLGVGKSPSA